MRQLIAAQSARREPVRPSSNSCPCLPCENRNMPKTDVTIRRAPRIWSFMLTGAFAGIIVAAVITVATPVDPGVGVMPTFGFFALFGFAIGLILGGLVGSFLDRYTKTSRGVAEITETKERTPKARPPRN